MLVKLKQGLEAGVSVRAIALSEDERKDFVDDMQLITDKPVLYVCNVDEASAVSEMPMWIRLRSYCG